MSDEELRGEAKKLQDLYASDLTDHFADELVDFRSIYKEEIRGELSGPRAILQHVIHEEMTLSWPGLTTAIKLLLVIRVTVASAERSFSKLKLIKTYLRTTMSAKAQQISLEGFWQRGQRVG